MPIEQNLELSPQQALLNVQEMLDVVTNGTIINREARSNPENV